MASPAPSNRLRQTERLRKSRDFASVFRRRTKTVADRRLRIHLAPNNLPVTRLGVSVGKRVGNAVTRNAVKRRIREAFRQKKAGLPTGFDIVCVALPGAADSLVAIAESFDSLTTRAFQGRNQSCPHNV